MKENLIAFKRLHAKAQCIIRKAKHTSCWTFVSSLSQLTCSRVVRTKLWRMTRKCSQTFIPDIPIGRHLSYITERCFQHHCFILFISLSGIRTVKNSAGALCLNFLPWGAEAYKAPFSMGIASYKCCCASGENAWEA
jgi:hypothetical protein